jgi:hypothetical protein
MATIPPLMWAQDKTRVFVTIKLQDIENADITFSDSGLRFKGTTRSPRAEYDFTLELYGELLADDPETKINKFGRYTQLNLRKKDASVWWPRLAKTPEKLHNVRIDWEKWVEEDEVEDVKPSKRLPDQTPTSFSSSSSSGSDNEDAKVEEIASQPETTESADKVVESGEATESN